MLPRVILVSAGLPAEGLSIWRMRPSRLQWCGIEAGVDDLRAVADVRAFRAEAGLSGAVTSAV